MTLLLIGPPPSWKAQVESEDLQNVKRGAEFVSCSEVVALRRTRGQVRDADKAMFNPALSNSRNPFAAVLPPALVGLLYPTLLSEERPR